MAAASAFLQPGVGLVEAEITWDEGAWHRFELGAVNHKTTGDYVAPYLPVEFHCHGMGPFDFSDVRSIDLAEVDRLAQAEGVACVITAFLPRHRIDEFDEFMHRFHAYRHGSSNLVGVALEGPLLSSIGGTPATGTWAPTEAEWLRIAGWGKLGLRYVVLSPDMGIDGTPVGITGEVSGPDVVWIAGALATEGISPSLGHFQKADAGTSARSIQAVLDAVRASGDAPPPVLTDHLFNDMPLSFRHAWRTAEDRSRRDEELAANRLEDWTLDNLEQLAGPIPAALIRAAVAGDLILCLNFDGEHVDPIVCKRVVELVGADAVIAMTDRIEVASLAGVPLSRVRDNGLWYQSGIVAAGSTAIDQQMHMMRALGLSEHDIWQIASGVAYRALRMSPADRVDGLDMARFSHMSSSFQRTAIP